MRINSEKSKKLLLASNHFGVAVRDHLLRGGRMSKIANQVVSFAPSFGGAATSLSTSVFERAVVAVVVLFSLTFVVSSAFAQSLPSECTTTPNPLVAGGTVDCVAPAPEVIQGSVATVLGDISVNIGDVETATTLENAAGNGVSLAGAASQTLNIKNPGSAVTGSENGVAISVTSGEGDLVVDSEGAIVGEAADGINASNAGSGSLTILTSGDVTGLGNGINVFNGPDSANLSVTTRGIVTGSGGDGIRADNFGTGALNILAVGDVTGLNDGINALNSSSGANLSVTSHGVVRGSEEDGINVTNSGSGSLTVFAVGDVIGLNDGINALNSSSGANLSVTTQGIVKGSEEDGINVTNSGSGSLTVFAAGDVTGFFDGLSASNGANGTDLSVTTHGVVTGSQNNGIQADNKGKGALTILAAGDVTSDRQGIYAFNRSGGTDLSVTTRRIVTGSEDDGIHADNDGTGALTILAAGDVTGGDDGIDANNSSNGLDLSVTTHGTVTGLGEHGIRAVNFGMGSLTTLATGDVVGRDSGINAVNNFDGTDLSVTTRETVTGSRRGIFAFNQGTGALTILATGDVSGSSDGILVENSDGGTDLTVTTRGTVTGLNGDGIEATNRGKGSLMITSSGSVSGEKAGIRANTAAGALTEISLNAGAKVEATSGVAIVNNEGDSLVTVHQGASVVGAINLGAGSDYLRFHGGDFSNLTVFDGGDDFDTLSFADTRGTLTGANIQNVENIVIGHGAKLEFLDRTVSVDNITISKGGILNADGGLIIFSELTSNIGVITARNGTAGDTIRVAGDFEGAGTIALDADFSTSTSDTLIVEGDVAGAATLVDVTDVSVGATANEDILVVDVAGNVTGGDFALANGPVSSGILVFDLLQQGNQFFLTSIGINGSGAVYEAAPSALLGGFADLGTLEQRTGGRLWLNSSAGNKSTEVGRLQVFTSDLSELNSERRYGAWLKLRGGYQNVLSEISTSNLNYESTTFGIQAGVDILAADGKNGKWILGATTQFGVLSTDVANANGSGDIDATGYGIGATATWYGNSGTYFDFQGQVNQVETDFRSSNAGSLASNEVSTAYAASIEIGQRLPISDYGTLIPQAQLTLGHLSSDSFIDNDGNAVDPGSNNLKVARLGLAYEYAFTNDQTGENTKAYTLFNLVRDFSNTHNVSVADTTLSLRNNRTWAEVGVGGSYALRDQNSLFVEGAYRASISGGSNDNRRATLTAGYRTQW